MVYSVYERAVSKCGTDRCSQPLWNANSLPAKRATAMAPLGLVPALMREGAMVSRSATEPSSVGREVARAGVLKNLELELEGFGAEKPGLDGLEPPLLPRPPLPRLAASAEGPLCAEGPLRASGPSHWGLLSIRVFRPSRTNRDQPSAIRAAQIVRRDGVRKA